MPIDLEPPEPYLFAFRDRGRLVYVRVVAPSYRAAHAAFAAMTLAEKRARVVGLLARHDRDHMAEFAQAVGGLFRRLMAVRG